jgi:hypothetical protein
MTEVELNEFRPSNMQEVSEALACIYVDEVLKGQAIEPEVKNIIITAYAHGFYNGYNQRKQEELLNQRSPYENSSRD